MHRYHLLYKKPYIHASQTLDHCSLSKRKKEVLNLDFLHVFGTWRKSPETFCRVLPLPRMQRFWRPAPLPCPSVHVEGDGRDVNGCDCKAFG